MMWENKSNEITAYYARLHFYRAGDPIALRCFGTNNKNKEIILTDLLSKSNIAHFRRLKKCRVFNAVTTQKMHKNTGWPRYMRVCFLRLRIYLSIQSISFWRHVASNTVFQCFLIADHKSQKIFLQTLTLCQGQLKIWFVVFFCTYSIWFNFLLTDQFNYFGGPKMVCGPIFDKDCSNFSMQIKIYEPFFVFLRQITREACRSKNSITFASSVYF